MRKDSISPTCIDEDDGLQQKNKVLFLSTMMHYAYDRTNKEYLAARSYMLHCTLQQANACEMLRIDCRGIDIVTSLQWHGAPLVITRLHRRVRSDLAERLK